MEFLNSSPQTATEAAAPPWERAHRDLNTIRDGLMKYREEAQARGRQAEMEINEIDNALSRIAPPQAVPIGAMSAVPSAPRPW